MCEVLTATSASPEPAAILLVRPNRSPNRRLAHSVQLHQVLSVHTRCEACTYLSLLRLCEGSAFCPRTHVDAIAPQHISHRVAANVELIGKLVGGCPVTVRMNHRGDDRSGNLVERRGGTGWRPWKSWTRDQQPQFPSSTSLVAVVSQQPDQISISCTPGVSLGAPYSLLSDGRFFGCPA